MVRVSRKVIDDYVQAPMGIMRSPQLSRIDRGAVDGEMKREMGQCSLKIYSPWSRTGHRWIDKHRGHGGGGHIWAIIIRLRPELEHLLLQHAEGRTRPFYRWEYQTTRWSQAPSTM